MAKSRFGWSRMLVLTLALTGFSACDDSEDNDSNNNGGGGGDVADASTPDASNDNRPDASAPDAASQGAKNIVELAAGDARFSSLVFAVNKAGLADELSAPGPLTVFAPTNEAFAAALATLGKTPDQLTEADLVPILTYHVISGEVRSTDLQAGPVQMLSGVSAFVSTSGGAKINDANVISADLEASNGVIHVIDKVILPPNLVQAATLAGNFGSLLGAATSAGLAETLSAPGADLTVFAPSDAAFAKLPAVPTGDALKNVLLYHAVGGKVLSSSLTAGSVPSLLTGQNLSITLNGGGVQVNEVPVVAADIVTTNGIIHVIGDVLIPPG